MMLLRRHDGYLAGASDHAGDGNGHILLLEVMLIDCTVQKLPENANFQSFQKQIQAVVVECQCVAPHFYTKTTDCPWTPVTKV